MIRWLLILCCVVPLWAGDAKVQSSDVLDAEEQEQRRLDTFLREAAEYRIGRSQATPDPEADAIVVRELEAARTMRDSGGRAWYHLWLISRVTRARWIALDAWEEHPYTSHAGALIHFMLECRAEASEVRGTLTELQRLWYYIPDYPSLSAAMLTALELGERLQKFETAVDLEAEDPREVVQIDGRSFIFDIDDLFRFLSKHGDRETIAPRAALALARSKLLSGDKEDRWMARRAYEDFLERFPDSPLVFEAVLEQALSHLVTYKGADYDVGALLDARDLVDIAELEAGGDPGRAALVTAYRKRITAWLQDRDLSVAMWYSRRTRPAWLEWLKRPPELKNADNGARFYANAVINRDRASPQSGRATALLRVLPTEADMLRTAP